ncbi:FMN-dependent alpha-hydroxy acid dehydrogenase [Lindgomyces ingoldianus]|uniref:FMN-dependent alpha-hydroxy acid dehydrogenase n=1 Tax=Lindgomyces ingoldianus TaxID=673940 RepID=A0ACB6QG86_9PLEO|nr:FMN-dependent alpha-hydroxy acid dehydrogenase [Lindgomyces ingoldianus]KAF2465896.1 FMN-dependent alpha-hydroxy acid dehydrogenase [Lindgomyces ingoldianus]
MAGDIPSLKDIPEPDPESFVRYQRDIYANLRKPAFSTKPTEWEAQARKAIPLSNFLYIYGSASSEETHAGNLSAFDRYRLRPWMLVEATRRDLSVELFGTRYSSPLLVAPIGVQEIAHPDGEEATARACASVKIPMILSTAATRSIEQVAKANGDGDRWYQLYWPKPQAEELTVSLLSRAKANGFKVLVVTLDTFMIGWRPNDLDESYLPFIYGQGCQVGFSDPVFNRMYEKMRAEDTRSATEKLSEIWQILKRPGTFSGTMRVLANAATMKKAMLFTTLVSSGTYREWKHLQILRKYWDGPIVLKGIQTVEDAHRSIDHGMDGIIVSNHGGRQLNGAISSLDALAEIGGDGRVKKSGLTVLFDSGIRTGSDVLKAIALGAKAVLLGRPYVYGLAMGGESGVKHVLECILADTDNSLANLGKKSISDLSREDLRVMQQPAKL